MSVRSSGYALLLVVVVSALVGFVDQVWAAAYVVPVALLARAGVTGWSSSRRNRPLFPNRAAWREAERRAVASAFLPALLRRRP